MTPLAIRKHRTARLTRMTALAAGLAAAFALSACTTPGGDPSQAASTGQLRVVATTTQLADFAGVIGDGDIELHRLMQPGASAHHFDPSPADLLALAQADVLLTNGLGLEPFLDSAIEASGFRGEIVTASDGIDLEAAEHVSEEMGGGHDHGDAEPAADTHEPADAHESADTHESADDHDGHDHGPINPHIWTSARQAQGMVAEVSRGLSAADSVRASDYELRAANYIERLQHLDDWATAQFARVPDASRVLVTGHDSLSYYLHDYDIAFAGAILPSFEDNAEPSATDIDALVARIKQLEVPAIFVESSMSPKLARTIARESGARVIDADALYADALGPIGSGADTYIDATVNNTRVMLEAWGFDPDPLPAGIADAGGAAGPQATGPQQGASSGAAI